MDNQREIKGKRNEVYYEVKEVYDEINNEIIFSGKIILNDSKEAIMFCMKTKSLLMTPGQAWYYQLESKFWIEKYAEK